MRRHILNALLFCFIVVQTAAAASFWNFPGGSAAATFENVNSASYNGSSSITTYAFYAPPAAFTVMCWANQSATGTNPVVMAQWSASTSERSWIIGADTTDKLLVLLSSNGTTVTKNYVSTGSVFSAGWHQIGFTYDGAGDTLTLYADGSALSVTKTTDTAMSQIFNTGTAAMTAGAIIKNAGGSPASFWNGLITHCSLWDVALSGAEFAAAASSNVPITLLSHSRVSDLIHWYQMGNLTDDATNIYDRIGSLHGTSTNVTISSSNP